MDIERRTALLWALGIIMFSVFIIGGCLMAFRTAEQNREKDVHMMQLCIDQGGTYISNPPSCVQPNRRGL